MRNRLSWQGIIWSMSTIRERNKELILRAASEEFADKGFAATKTSDIAAKAGLPKPNVYYYFKSKDNLYREVLESIIEPILAASTPFNPDGDPKQVLSSYIRSKISISRDLPFASKVFASEIMHGAPHLSPEQVQQLNAQAKHNIDCIQSWVDRGLIAAIDPNHLMFSIWAATQTYADFDWQISAVTGKAKLDEADYEAAAQTIIRETNRIYLISTNTHERVPIFSDFHLGRLVVWQFRLAHYQGLANSLAWVVMPDHFHWLIDLQKGSLGDLMCQ
eukprot:gene6775-6627_t